jgi:Tol biopolymer transport system component/DNA-binding winged helix-turn-helix (wHTH) protein
MLPPSLFRGMSENSQSVSAVIRFGPFDADLQTQELRKHGVRLRLPRQSFQILRMLLERPGSLITREELRQVLWPSDTFVDFDHSLNAAVNRLREALGDSADEPRLVETLPRRGYRFIGEIALPATAPEPPSATAVSTLPATAEVLPTADTRWTWHRIGAALLAAAICVFLAMFVFLRWRNRSDSPSSAAVPFTALPGWAGYPAFSPDGSRIAFAWVEASGDATKDANLYVKKIGSEDLLRLTSQSSELIAPAWSPDGKQIAFQRLFKGEGGIYVVPAEGGAERKLRSTHASFGPSMNIRWSPDGKSIAFADSPVSGGHRRLHLLSVETLESSQIEHDEKCQEEGLPAFSHDGKQLAYACFPTLGDFALSIAASAGAAPRLSKAFSGYLLGLEWTGDNKKLIFSHTQTGDAHETLSELTIADGSVRELLVGRRAVSLTLDAKGDRMAFTVETGNHNNIWRGDLLHPQTPQVKLISTTRDQLCPQYSPDGKHIAFASNRGGPGEIWMSDPDGTNVVRLTDLKNIVTGTPSWSPDSTKIVFDSRTEIHPGQHHADLYIVDIAERVPRKLNTSTDQASVPFWSRDGKWIYFMGGSDDVAGERIDRVAPEGGHAQVLTSARGYGPQESFDGQWVYFVHGGSTRTLQMASLNPTGTESRVESMPPLSFGTNWTLVRDGVYFFPAEDFLTLSYFDFATKRMRPVFKAGGGVFLGTSVSPDGRYILYAQFDDARSDIMLVNDFH